MLIKSTTAAIPSYAKDTFLFLDTICSKLDKIFKGFWWGFPKGKSRNLSLKSWSSICLPRQACGFGFRLMKDVNLAPIAKLGWKSLTNFDSIWVQQLSVKYIKYGSFFFLPHFHPWLHGYGKEFKKANPLWFLELVFRLQNHRRFQYGPLLGFLLCKILNPFQVFL
jgi:hypothetical protein